eukprot:TRINITY_DN5402_c0_g1::TRINITY_DN5402_c0_g1_i1::g.24220::m.24220 TRINITY_DN5402_c0_g1::TRINITY_DN5402_c0_g1_i1::g.24220  ORF type:complete len:465 (+),score=81.99,sp/Q9SJA7/SOX_ARATH/34.00/2e-74,DAO/PF01266.19/2.6e-54,NAD_binding_8/PF13450.1/7.3e-05,NAD_binding_8/PF13450.1/1.1e+04,NAD_binding_8/PF13450.1/7.3e+02,FAD_binding_2/PF00890.19/0.00069,GIDA/PF01134.17/0.0091,GIDA/PF01134.17/0.83,GIDA/PF01134.17/7.8e+03,Pyr_redox_2/PF07992.9/0.0059,Pyr_redox_2/PF07992.9/7.7e+02,Pyr_redox_2/PF07992.9/8.5e+
MSTSQLYDIIVIGAGIMGSATAYYAAQRPGCKVLLLEQFRFGHTKGSSHGPSRIIRPTYVQKHYTELMFDAYRMWDELEKKSSKKLITQTGGLDFGPKDEAQLLQLVENCKSYNVPHEILSAAECGQRFPSLTLPDHYMGVYNPQAGIVDADLSVHTYQEEGRKCGVHMKEHCEVIEIREDIDAQGHSIMEVVVKGDHAYSARKVVVTAGPWATRLVKEVAAVKLNVVPVKTTAAYWHVDPAHIPHYTADKFPIFIRYADNGLGVYGFPIFEYPGLLKACVFGGPQTDPQHRDYTPEIDELKTKLVPALEPIFNGVHFRECAAPDACHSGTEMHGKTQHHHHHSHSHHHTHTHTHTQNQCGSSATTLQAPAKTVSCMFAMTPDEDFVLDFLPNKKNSKNVVIGAGFSGHGFKLAPVVGAILSQLALDGHSTFDVKPYSINRPNILLH